MSNLIEQDEDGKNESEDEGRKPRLNTPAQTGQCTDYDGSYCQRITHTRQASFLHLPIHFSRFHVATNSMEIIIQIKIHYILKIVSQPMYLFLPISIYLVSSSFYCLLMFC